MENKILNEFEKLFEENKYKKLISISLFFYIFFLFYNIISIKFRQYSNKFFSFFLKKNQAFIILLFVLGLNKNLSAIEDITRFSFDVLNLILKIYEIKLPSQSFDYLILYIKFLKYLYTIIILYMIIYYFIFQKGSSFQQKSNFFYNYFIQTYINIIYSIYIYLIYNVLIYDIYAFNLFDKIKL